MDYQGRHNNFLREKPNRRLREFKGLSLNGITNPVENGCYQKVYSNEFNRGKNPIITEPVRKNILILRMIRRPFNRERFAQNRL